MIPLKSEEPRRSVAIVNGLLIAINVVAFMYQLSLPPRAQESLIFSAGVVPARAERMLAHPAGHVEATLTPLVTSMFLHAGWLHLLGNMLFLWVFGRNVEDRLGHLLYFVFYMFCGIAAGLTFIIADWGTTIPSIGASGAISGVMGAYIIFFPRSRVLTLIPLIFFFFTVRLPALLFLGYWFLLQFLSGIDTLGQSDQGGVAVWAHIGGFVVGAILVLGMRRNRQYPAY